MWLSFCFQRQGFRAFGAFEDARLLGLFSMYAHTPVAGLGPVVVDPESRNPFVAFSLYRAVLEAWQHTGGASARGTVVRTNPQAVALHRLAGGADRDEFTTFHGKARSAPPEGLAVRPMVAADVQACGLLCNASYGFSRDAEVADAARFRAGLVVLRGGELRGYSTGIGTGGHSVGVDRAALQGLILGAPRFLDAGFNVPDRDRELFDWCKVQGFEPRAQMRVVSYGEYQAPPGFHLPSLYF